MYDYPWIVSLKNTDMLLIAYSILLFQSRDAIFCDEFHLNIQLNINYFDLFQCLPYTLLLKELQFNNLRELEVAFQRQLDY